MSTINTNTSQSVIDQYQLKQKAGTTGDAALGKDSFLQLLVAQMENQNPLDPQDNTQFVAQLAQFSSLESMNNLNSTVESFMGSYQSSQALQASSLVGRSVIVETDKSLVDTSSSLTGNVMMPANGSNLTVKVYDDKGNLVKTLPMGDWSAGTVDFIWDGVNEQGEKVPSGNYKFVAEAEIDGTPTALSTFLPATVNSVTLAGGEMYLNLAGMGRLPLSSVLTIGQ